MHVVSFSERMRLGCWKLINLARDNNLVWSRVIGRRHHQLEFSHCVQLVQRSFDVWCIHLCKYFHFVSMSFGWWKWFEFAWSGSHVIWGWGQNIKFWTYFTICMPLISGFGLECVCSFISCARKLQIPKFDRTIIDCIFSCYEFLENWKITKNQPVGNFLQQPAETRLMVYRRP